MEKCNLCPRECNVSRRNGNTGVCGQTNELRVARAALHYWEEPCISGTRGSGAIFFTGCPLQCVYCQNYQIANGTVGKAISVNRLSEIMMELQKQGANNINLVTATQFVPQIIEALTLAKKQGLTIPIVYNTSSYEKIDTLRLLEGYVDIYLPDLKYMDDKLSTRYSHANDYYIKATTAIAEMVRQVGSSKIDRKTGMMKRGVIVRHLCLPGYKRDSERIIKYLYETYGDSIYISIMNQYTPLDPIAKYPEINRKLTEEEYDELVEYAINLGVENGFIQEGETAEESFIPEFDLKGL